MARARILLALVASGRVVSAAEVSWTAPEPCPDRETIARRVRDAIAMPLEKAANTRFMGRVTKAREGTFRLELSVEVPGTVARTTPRIIEAPTCEQVAETAAVAIALALGADMADPAQADPTQDHAEPGPTDAESSSADPAVSATNKPRQVQITAAKVVPSQAPDQARSALKHVWAAIAFGPTIDLGALPGLSAGPHAGFELGYRAISVRLLGSYLAEKRTMLADGTGGDFSLWGITLALCGATPRASAHGRICAGVELGRMDGRGVGNLKSSHDQSTFWATPEVDVAVVSPPWFFGMRMFAGALAGLPLARRPFTLDGTEEVHRASSVVLRLNGGLEIDWQ